MLPIPPYTPLPAHRPTPALTHLDMARTESGRLVTEGMMGTKCGTMAWRRGTQHASACGTPTNVRSAAEAGGARVKGFRFRVEDLHVRVQGCHLPEVPERSTGSEPRIPRSVAGSSDSPPCISKTCRGSTRFHRDPQGGRGRGGRGP